MTVKRNDRQRDERCRSSAHGCYPWGGGLAFRPSYFPRRQGPEQARGPSGPRYNRILPHHPSESTTVEIDDLGGAAGGALGGLVRWTQDPHRTETAWERVTAAATSCACGIGFGYLTQAVIQWQCPTVPHSVAVGCSFVAGLASGVLSQAAVGLVSEVLGRVRGRILDRIGPTNGPPAATGSADSPSPKPGGNPADAGAVRN